MISPDADTQQKRAFFRQLHAQGCFVLPNPWDVGSARYLQRQGFRHWPRPVPAAPGVKGGRMGRFRCRPHWNICG